MAKSKYRKAVFIVVYNLENKKPEYIILKRKLHWKGWEFPKGKIEDGEKKVEAAKREAHEETGLKIIKIRRFPFSGKYLYSKALPDRNGLIGQTFSLYAAEVKKGKVKLDKKEHDRHKWADFKTALKMLKWPNQKKSLKFVNHWLEQG
jgi:8-oxo-dGTP pyrophosphatase MutT (NUDIX family)